MTAYCLSEHGMIHAAEYILSQLQLMLVSRSSMFPLTELDPELEPHAAWERTAMILAAECESAEVDARYTPAGT